MRKLLCALVVSASLPLFAGVAFGLDHFKVVVPRDTKSFAVEQDTYVRLHGHGEAKCTITCEIISGPARIVSVNDVFPRKSGEPVANTVIKEFNLKQTGKGTVKARITMTPAAKEATPKVTTYEYEVR